MDTNVDQNSELVRSASGGILLRGVCLKRLSESTAYRQTVTDVKQKIELKSPLKVTMHCDKKFSNEHEMQEFERNIRDFRIAGSIDFSGNMPLADFELDTSVKREKEKQGDFVNSASQASEINVTYTIVPSALWESSLPDFKLSRSAINDLIKVEKSMSMLETEVDRLCKKFFDKFGTHIIVGNVHFGGIKVGKNRSIEKQTRSSFRKKRGKQFHSSVSGRCASGFKTVALGTNLDVGNLNSEEMHMLEKEKHVSNCTEEYYIGGPPNCQTEEEWRNGLSKNVSTWSVIHRDVTKDHNFEPIWKLILEETEFFQDATELAHCLRKRMPPEPWQIEFAVHEEKCLKSTIDSLHSLIQKDRSEETCIECITQLLNKIINLEYNAVWRNILKHYNPASEILLFTTQDDRTSQYEIDLRRCLTKIMEHSEGTEFKHKFEVTSWLLKVSQEKHDKLPDIEIEDIRGLVAWIETGGISKTAQSLPAFKFEQNHCITNVFCKAVSVLISNVRQHDYQSDYILLLAALMRFDFDYQEGSFRTQLTSRKITEFLQCMKDYLETYNKFAERSVILKHAWALLLLFDNIREVSNFERKCLSNLIEQLKTNKIKLEESVIKIIKTSKGLKGIQTELQKLLEDDTENILCWKIFERKSTIPCSDLPAAKISSSSTPPPPDRISDILKDMEFSRYYPGKLTLQRVLEIDENTFQKPKCLKDIPFVILKKILSCNFKFREKILNDFFTKTPKSMTSIFDSDEECSDGDDIINESDNFHPLDVFYCIYLCCDPFLKCLLCKKITEVQLAIPLVYPCGNEKLLFSLWPLRKIFIGDQVDTIARSLCYSVCFLKVGHVSFMSKSKLINEFMRDQNVEHSTFFNAQCPLGLKRRKAYNGIIEMACYIPSESAINAKNADDDYEPILERAEEEIDKKLLILNLRGDANKYPKQTELILQMSNIIVVLVEFSNLKNEEVVNTMKRFHCSNVKVIMVTNNSADRQYKDLNEDFKKYKKHANVSSSRTSALFTTNPKTKERKNAVSIKDELIATVKYFLQKSKGIILENITNTAPAFVIVDELEGNCALGRKEAESLILKIREQANGRLDKTIALPLQGKALWLEWSIQQKRLFDTEKSRTDDEVEQLTSTLLTIRKKQTDICNSHSNIIGDFVEKILCCNDNMEKVLFFLSWLQEFLDSESRKIVPEKIECVLQAYNLFRSCSKKEDDVKQAEEKLSIASFGIENFFREIGQIYECYSYCVSEGGYMIEATTASVIQSLPKAVAKLLISGLAFEIMDGDAVNIPINWMKAVFEELKTIIGNKKVFSISVIGVQSSGKSTLLNSMFGLEFPVRSGRCTKGVFLRVLPVTKRIANFDYAFVFDTEGLNSLTYGLETTKHDNKLATLAIGLADIVIINIMGETIGENIKNTLEIVIHALLRLKQANNHIELNQSCIFVHQNVSKTGKGIELKPDVQRMYQKLDEVTREVAIQEHLDNIASFNDVISFDVERDVLHIPNILQGHPPMAPVSQKYSENVEKIAEHVLIRGIINENCHLSITDTCDLIESVWEGILSENFVFSFRNCLEVKAYNLLESKFICLALEIEMMPQIFWNNKVRQTLYKCTERTIEEEERSLIHEFKTKFEKIVELGREKLLKFIHESELRDHMIHWKDRKVNNLIESSQKIEEKFENKIKQAVIHTTVRLRNDEMGSEEKIMQKISDYAKSWKGKTVSEENKHKMFKELWVRSLNEVAPNCPLLSHAQKQKELLSKMKSMLYKQFHAHTNLVQRELKTFDANDDFGLSYLFDYDHDIDESFITVKSNWGKHQMLSDAFNEYKNRTVTLTKKIYHKVLEYLKFLEHLDAECDETHFGYILNLVTFKEMDSNDREFSITHLYQIKVAVRVARFSFWKFSAMNRLYEEKHNLYSLLQSKKLQAEQVFFDILQEKADAEIVANYLCTELKTQMKKNISKSMSLKVKEKMSECFAFTKSKMITEIMTELAEKNHFDEYMLYIRSPEVYVKQWIKEKTRCECFERKGDQFSFFVRNAEKILSRDVSHIIHYARKTTEDLRIRTLEDWIKSLCANLNSFEIHERYASLFSTYQVKDLKSFCGIFTAQVSEVEADLLNAYKKENADDLEWDNNSPYEDIFQFLWGCTEHCPLCLEPCKYTEADHFRKDDIPHRCIQHRPFAVGGNFLQDSDELIISTCNYAIQTTFCKGCGEWCNCQNKNYTDYHPLRNYKTFMPSWDIEPSLDIEGSRYWCWFTATYSKFLALYFGRIPPKIPPRWKVIAKEKALSSLDRKHSSPLPFFLKNKFWLPKKGF